MTKSIAVFGPAMLALLVGCTADIRLGDPAVEVASLRLVPDTLGGLQVADCVERLGADRCPVLPNDYDCDRLTVSVRGDASTVGTCRSTVAGALQVDTIQSGIPISCRVREDLGCIQCVDTADRPVLDTCGQVALYTGQLAQPEGLPGGSGVLTTGEGDEESEEAAPSGSGAATCSADQASDLFEKRLNELLRSEGLSFSFVSPRSDGAKTKLKPKMCEKDKSIGNMLKKGCDGSAEKEGFCYCWKSKKGPACRTARIVARAVSEACAAVPDGCATRWDRRLWSERAAATAWLMKGSYGGKSWLGKGSAGQVPPTGEGGPAVPRPGFNDISGPGGIIAKGSPLVVDLRGDGIRLTSPRDGVRFDLLGVGPQRTAWVAGADDALLVLDRDGNGRVDGGWELFGEASTLGGRLAGDGFQALAMLDRPALGGNDNGLVESGDLMFGQLRLWVDANRDGVSQPGELRALAEEGITALLTGARGSCETDAHGNDLALWGTFLRVDGGNGAVVDVYLVNR